MTDDVKATAYTQISQWSDCSYDDLAKTRNALDQLPPTEVSGLFLSSVVERLKADSLPKDSVL